jgi:class 3 adenylate cyclase/tetratricopeptide (TPR) repeat protein
MVRKTVTLVFCDVADSTPLGERLDPEALRDVWSRYHETARDVLERHGGTIEKFVGDAVLGVFGIPVVHEDDALRAVRAAVELRDALTGLNDKLEHTYGVRIDVRTGINTGDVFAGDPSQGDPFATGDAVVVAQRLEASAAGGEILVGDATIRLVRDAVSAEQLPPLTLKGKSDPVAAWRLLDVEPGVAGLLRRMDSPLVGRTAELARLREEFERAETERSCRLVTVLGEPGVGKSRLAMELVASLDEPTLVLEGHCLPYGSGITYWPLVEIVGRLDLERVLADEPDGETVRRRLLEAVGRAEPTSRSDELYWAVRRLLETLARERPVVLLLDDVQWAEPAFLDLIEYLDGWSRDAPILVCCLARSDLAELRPSWAATGTIELRPLNHEDGRQLLENLAGPLDPAAAEAVGRATGGNPLFLEEMLRMLVEDGVLVESDGLLRPLEEVVLRVPATVQAVLAARLDLLDAEELAVLQRAAVIGQVFWWGAVADLAPPERVGEVAGRLQGLVRKGLIKPDARTFAGEDGFRFGHILIRDAAYESMPKRLRAELHERFAGWVEERIGEGTEFDEILGHHLEQAYALRVELAPADATALALASRAAERLARAGRRALAREDSHAAVGLLERAVAMRADDAALLVDLAEALFGASDFAEAERVNHEAEQLARSSGDERSELAARLSSAMIGLLTRSEGGADEIAAEVTRALPTFEEAGDDATVARLLTRLAAAYWWHCQVVPMEQTLERALEHARLAGDERQRGEISVRLGIAAVVGPLPVADARVRVDEFLSEAADETAVRSLLLVASGRLAAMAGDFEAARSSCAKAHEILAALGRTVDAAVITTWTSIVELLAGDPAAAERELRPAQACLEQAGERANLSSLAAQLAEALYAQGRNEDVLTAAAKSRDAASTDDVHAQVAWRSACAKALAGLARRAEADLLAREAVELALTTDSPVLAADALYALAIALGGDAEAQTTAERALALYEEKGNVVEASLARRLTAAGAEARTASTVE